MEGKRMKIEPSLASARDLDQFYTNPEVAAWFAGVIAEHTDGRTILEPSAGDRAFSALYDNCVECDLDPKHPSIVPGNFLHHTQLTLGLPDSGQVVAVGNPPFGKGGGLAVRFINHASSMADTVAFILPASFAKRSVQSRINPHLWLLTQLPVPKCAFRFEGKPYDVPCVAQVWRWRSERRNVVLRQNSTLFDWVSHGEGDLVVRRVGRRAGDVLSPSATYSKTTVYHLRTNHHRVIEAAEAMQLADRDAVAGAKSISKPELVEAIEESFVRLGETILH